PRAGGAGDGALALPDRPLSTRADPGRGRRPRGGAYHVSRSGGAGRGRDVPSRPGGRPGPAPGGGDGGGRLALVPRPLTCEGRRRRGRAGRTRGGGADAG